MSLALLSSGVQQSTSERTSLPSDLPYGAILIRKGTVKTLAARLPKAPNKAPKLEMVREELYGEPYEYYQLP